MRSPINQDPCSCKSALRARIFENSPRTRVHGGGGGGGGGGEGKRVGAAINNFKCANNGKYSEYVEHARSTYYDLRIVITVLW